MYPRSNYIFFRLDQIDLAGGATDDTMGHMTSTVMFVMLFAATAQCKSAIISSSSCTLSRTNNKDDWEFGSSDLTVAVFICRSCFQFFPPSTSALADRLIWFKTKLNLE